ncbi:MAG: hypothetical protein ABL958_02675 [Bdellovibrionia bacterium]
MKLNSLMMILLAAGVAASCGGDPIGGAPTAASGSVSFAQATALASGGTLTNMIANARPDQTPSFGGPVRSSNPDRGMENPLESRDADFSSCASATAFDTTDADGDGIVVHLAAKFACKGITGDGGYTSDLSGSFEQKDLDDTKDWAEGGYLFDYNMVFKTVLDASNSFSYRFKGYYKSENTGTSFTQAADFHYGVTGIHNALTIDYLWRGTYTSTITPTDMTMPYAAGTSSMTGFFTARGGYGSGTSATTVNVVFKIVGADLVYDTACANYYRSGTYTFSDAGGNAIVYTYDCNAATTRTYNGVTL